MEVFILGSPGPCTGLVTRHALVLVIFLRRSSRKRHVAALLVVTVTCVFAFFARLIRALSGGQGRMSVTVLQAILRQLAGALVGCGAAVGFSIILAAVGLVSPGSDEPPMSNPWN